MSDKTNDRKWGKIGNCSSCGATVRYLLIPKCKECILAFMAHRSKVLEAEGKGKKIRLQEARIREDVQERLAVERMQRGEPHPQTVAMMEEGYA